MNQRLGFFEQRATSHAVYRVASKTTDLTLFVGLGASLASGLPTWSGFARGVVEELAISSSGEDHRAAASAILESEDLLAAMEIARASWPVPQFEAAMVNALYGRPPVLPERAISHEAVAELAVEWFLANPNSKVTILTTNYDLLIERALHRLTPSTVTPEQFFGSSEVLESGERRLAPLSNFSLGCAHGGVVATPAGNQSWLLAPDVARDIRIRVVHLHGIVTPGENAGHVIATSSDYYRDDRSHKTARGLIGGALERSTCLFLGTSLSDPLVLSHLHNAGSERSAPANAFESLESDGTVLDLPYESHWRVPSRPLAAVLFSRESFPWAVAPELGETAKRGLEREYSAMWRRLRLAVVWSDFYSQPYQFLREVAFTRRGLAGDGYFEKSWPTRSRPKERKVEKQKEVMERTSYGKRIDAWSELYLHDLVLPKRHRRSGRKSRKLAQRHLWQQGEIRDFLLQYRDRAMAHLLNVQDPFPANEEWKLDLWVRSPADHSLLRIASTQYELLTMPRDAVAYPLDFQSELPAVRAFVNGAVSEEDGVGRWKYHLAVPVRQTPEVPSLSPKESSRNRSQWGDFPVGSLVLSSSRGREESILFTRSVTKRREVTTLLQVAGNEIVTFEAGEYPFS